MRSTTQLGSPEVTPRSLRCRPRIRGGRPLPAAPPRRRRRRCPGRRAAGAQSGRAAGRAPARRRAQAAARRRAPAAVPRSRPPPQSHRPHPPRPPAPVPERVPPAAPTPAPARPAVAPSPPPRPVVAAAPRAPSPPTPWSRPRSQPAPPPPPPVPAFEWPKRRTPAAPPPPPFRPGTRERTPRPWHSLPAGADEPRPPRPWQLLGPNCAYTQVFDGDDSASAADRQGTVYRQLASRAAHTASHGERLAAHQPLTDGWEAQRRRHEAAGATLTVGQYGDAQLLTATLATRLGVIDVLPSVGEAMRSSTSLPFLASRASARPASTLSAASCDHFPPSPSSHTQPSPTRPFSRQVSTPSCGLAVVGPSFAAAAAWALDCRPAAGGAGDDGASARRSAHARARRGLRGDGSSARALRC